MEDDETPSVSFTNSVNIPLSEGVAVSARCTTMVVDALYVGKTLETVAEVGVADHTFDKPSVEDSME